MVTIRKQVLCCGEDPRTKHHHDTQPANAEMVKVNTRYKGQKRWCRRCQGEHYGPCESLQSFYAAKDARTKEPIHAKVLSDSTLRRAEQIGLLADILCMSVAGVGHLANALRDDPQLQDKGELGLIMGQNDVRNSEGLEDLEFVRSIEKVRQGMERQPNKSLAIFMKVDDPMAPTLSPDLARREKYLEREIGVWRRTESRSRSCRRPWRRMSSSTSTTRAR